jgi:molybdate transport system substrate-binding protein
MKTASLFRILTAALAVLAAQAQAGEVRLLSSAAIRPVIDALASQFERDWGNRLVVRYELTPAVKRLIEEGTAFDVAIANPPHIEDLMKQGRVAAGSRADVARFGVGVGVRGGALRPSIGSVDALRRVLLEAKTVAYVGEGTSGVFFRGLLDRLAIAEPMKGKLKAEGVDASIAAVARGEADLVVMPMPLILAGRGAELAGPVPAELQESIDLAAGVSPGAGDPAAARAFIRFLRSAGSAGVMRAMGFEPIAP